jgi:hypothetical protein
MIVMARQTGSIRFVLTAYRKLTPLIAAPESSYSPSGAIIGGGLR